MNLKNFGNCSAAPVVKTFAVQLINLSISRPSNDASVLEDTDAVVNSNLHFTP
jgi:hypothetical protein